MKKTLLACVLAAASFTAHAQQVAAQPLRFVIGAGLTFGGDRLATTSYTNGTSANIRAGSGLQLAAGAEYRLSPLFSLQGTVGYHIHFTPEASNGDADFSRIPVELIAYYHANEKWRVGGGMRFVRNAKLSGSGFASGLDESFDDTTSGIVEAEYLYSPSLGFKLRGVSEKYDSRRYAIGSAKANHLGMFANFYF
ncbi:outer membrane beta-barrel protein [Massilia cavernae]|nr:outer membrane beta-barrel protein [Massilia cavernae]